MNEEFSKNRRDYLRCRRIHGTASKIYAFLNLHYLIMSLIIMFSNIQEFSIFTFVDGVVMKAAVFGFAYYGMYKKIDMMSFFPSVILVLNILLFEVFPEDVSSFLSSVPRVGLLSIQLVVSFILLGPILYANRKYRFLEKQAGFPHFNELLEEQRMELLDRKILNPYKRGSEERKKTESQEMFDIELNGEVIGEHQKEENNYMDEI